MSEYIAKASIEPRDYRVVFLIQTEAAALSRLITALLRGQDMSSFVISS